MREQLESIEPGSFQAYLRFMATGYDCQETSLKHFVGRNFRGILDYLSPANLPRMFRLKALSRHYDFTAKHFRDVRLRAAFSFQNMYLGLSPYDAMATYVLLQYSELAEGVWYPRGGLYAVVQALVRVAEDLGVEFHCDSPVAQIEVSDRSASGLVLESGERTRRYCQRTERRPNWMGSGSPLRRSCSTGALRAPDHRSCFTTTCS
jgi:phytoene dehydrogenase-like protein